MRALNFARQRCSRTVTRSPFLKCGNQLAGTFAMAVGFNRHAPDRFGQFSHNQFSFAHAATGARDENLEARALAAEMSIEERKRQALFEHKPNKLPGAK